LRRTAASAGKNASTFAAKTRPAGPVADRDTSPFTDREEMGAETPDRHPPSQKSFSGSRESRGYVSMAPAKLKPD